MPQFGAAECLGVHAAGFLELERNFLRGSKSNPPADHVQIFGGFEFPQSRRPIQPPASIHEIG